MTIDSVNNADDRIVVGYFSNSADASRAISELIDEGFQPVEIGAAFRTSRAAMEVTEGGRQRPTTENSAVTGSVGGPASHDEAVTPAGLAPGSGAAFPAAPTRPGPISGSAIPSTLKHELPHDLPSTLRSEAEIGSGRPVRPAGMENNRRWENDETRREQLREVFAENDNAGARRSSSSMKFGTGEGHLFPDYEYSEASFETSFLGMGLGTREARNLSGELGRGGAVVSVTPGSRASLAEGILERNHASVRFDSMSAAIGEDDDRSRVEIYGRMRNYYRPEESIRRKAS
jgi:hypothetical protein